MERAGQLTPQEQAPTEAFQPVGSGPDQYATQKMPASSYQAAAAPRPFVRPATTGQQSYSSGLYNGDGYNGSHGQPIMVDPDSTQQFPSLARTAVFQAAGANPAATSAGTTATNGTAPHAPQHARGSEPVAKPKYEPLGPVRATIRGFGELCITAGLIMILFVVWQLWWTDIEANKDNENLASTLITKWKDNPQNELPDDPDTPVVAETPAENEAFGIMYVPRFGDDYYRTIAEGVQLEPVLNRMGMGHYPSTARPGEVGNFAMAGHRVTYGKPLNLIAELRPGDPVVIQTAEGFYTYTFRNFEIVLPNQTEVLAPVPAHPDYKGKERIMTLTACNPMFSARERYIAYAELTDWRPASEGAPDSIKDSPAFKKAGGQ